MVWIAWRRWLIQMWPGSSPHSPPWCFSPRCCRGSTGSAPGTVPPIQVASPALASPGCPRGSRGLRPTEGTGGRPEDPRSLAQPGSRCLLPLTARLLPDLEAPAVLIHSHRAHISLSGALPPLLPPLHRTQALAFAMPWASLLLQSPLQGPSRPVLGQAVH